jgi:hypothetical protein
MPTLDAMTPAQKALAGEIAQIRRSLLELCLDLHRSVDLAADGQWAVAIWAALEAGIPLEDVAKAASCASPTILRWRDGKSTPAPFARGAIHRALGRTLEGMLKAAREEKAAA